jgi:hypothetical protein
VSRRNAPHTVDCRACLLAGGDHVIAHPDLGCSDVGCYHAHPEPTSAPLPDTRTPGQVLYEATWSWDPGYLLWPNLIAESQAIWDRRAAAFLAHDAAQRAARGEVVVDARDLLRVMRYVAIDASRTGPAAAAMVRLRAALAAPTPKETD